VDRSRRRGSTWIQTLAKHTSMPVDSITPGLKLRPNHVYVSPPNQAVSVRNGAFQLSLLSVKDAWPTEFVPLLESLVRVWKGKIIAMVLRALDTNGANALRIAKTAGGITFSQKTDTPAEPGLVDFELTPAEMGR